MQFPVPLAVASSRTTLPEGPFAFEPKYDDMVVGRAWRPEAAAHPLRP